MQNNTKGLIQTLIGENHKHTLENYAICKTLMQRKDLMHNLCIVLECEIKDFILRLKNILYIFSHILCTF